MTRRTSNDDAKNADGRVMARDRVLRAILETPPYHLKRQPASGRPLVRRLRTSLSETQDVRYVERRQDVIRNLITTR